MHITIDDGFRDNNVQRNTLPKTLYKIGAYAKNEADILASGAFSWEKLTQEILEAHLDGSHHSTLTTSYISTYSSLSAACKQHLKATPSLPGTSTSTILTISTQNLVPAWAGMDTLEAPIPIWIEQGPLPKIPYGVLTLSSKGYEAFASSTWVCVKEMRCALGIESREIEGEWLACGKIPASMVSKIEKVIIVEQKVEVEKVVVKEVERASAVEKTVEVEKSVVPVAPEKHHQETQTATKALNLSLVQVPIEETPVSQSTVTKNTAKIEIPLVEATPKATLIDYTTDSSAEAPPTPPKSTHAPPPPLSTDRRPKKVALPPVEPRYPSIVEVLAPNSSPSHNSEYNSKYRAKSSPPSHRSSSPEPTLRPKTSRRVDKKRAEALAYMLGTPGSASTSANTSQRTKSPPPATRYTNRKRVEALACMPGDPDITSKSLAVSSSSPSLRPEALAFLRVPDQAHLIHPSVRPTSPLSKRSAETLAKLENVQLNGEALKMWIGDVREKTEKEREVVELKEKKTPKKEGKKSGGRGKSTGAVEGRKSSAKGMRGLWKGIGKGKRGDGDE